MNVSGSHAGDGFSTQFLLAPRIDATYVISSAFFLLAHASNVLLGYLFLFLLLAAALTDRPAGT
jgi:hypothetical protein